MKITFLGTGTSQGIPVIACKCNTCTSSNPKDRRLRTSAFVELEGVNLCIDVGPDFRQQMLSKGVDRLNAVLLTHEHNDHMIGADDLRPFNFIQRRDMPIFGEERVLNEIRQRFQYAFRPHAYPGIPQFRLTPIDVRKDFKVNVVSITPIRIHHGRLPIVGYRIGNFCYLTDVKTIPDEEFVKLKDIDVLVLNALRKKDHHSHLTLNEAVELSMKIAPKRTFLTHFSHDMGPVDSWESELPEGIEAAHDGLAVTST